MGSDVHDDDVSMERPSTFGEYHLLTTLAEGGMGSVHLAKRLGFRPDIQRFCVVKKLRRGRGNPGWLRRFHDEARVVVTLNHRALCHVFDVGIVNDEHYLAMELVEGVTLQKLMLEPTLGLEPGLALYVIDEVLDALQYAHEHKDPASGEALMIVHRDVSPHNVMLSFQGGVKLIDFGLVSSTLKTEHTVAGVVVGKLEYMSPEQARGEPLDVRSDVYAAAVILFELLSGRRFYGALTKSAIMLQLVEGSYLPTFDGVDAALVPALTRALTAERDHRTASCAALQAELAAAGGPRASSRELRDALQRALPEEKSRLEALVRSFRDIGVGPAPFDANTQVTHIARSDELSSSGPHSSSPDVFPAPTRPAPFAAAVAEVTTTMPDPVRRGARSAALALAVATLSGSAIIVVWLLARGGDPPAPPPVVAPNDVLVVSDPQRRAMEEDPAPPPIENAVADAGDAAGVASAVEAEGSPDAASKPPVRKSKRRPPMVALPDLAAQLDYLSRWCATQVPCAGPVLSARGRIAVLDVVGLRALRRDAQACVLECRR